MWRGRRKDGDMGTGYSRLYDILFVAITVVFFISFWNVMSMKPAEWLSIVGFIVCGQYLCSDIWNVIMKGEK